MKRQLVRVEDVASRPNLIRAVHRAAHGKRRRPEVQRYLEHFEANLAKLCAEITDGTVEVGRAATFHIRDPKPRVIHAPCFAERVLHHAIMNYVGPVLDRTLVDDTFACRVGGGTIAATVRCQQHVRRFPWYAKLDVQKYFASICHEELKEQLRRKLVSNGVFSLLCRIIDAHHSVPGRGLPIGALTSQCFANFYLGRLDRFALETCQASGIVRYMDDLVLWGASRAQVGRMDELCRAFLEHALGLRARPVRQINRSSRGVTLCGFRVLPGTIRLTAGRRRRFRDVQGRWERLWQSGAISGTALQRGFAAALGMTLHADACRWRQAVARRYPSWHDDV